MTGISINLFTTLDEIIGVQRNSTIFIAWAEKDKPENAIYSVAIPIESCEFLDSEVRVNVLKFKEYFEKTGKTIGTSMAIEFEKTLNNNEQKNKIKQDVKLSCPRCGGYLYSVVKYICVDCGFKK